MHYFEDETILRIFFTELEGYDDMEALYERFRMNLNANVLEKVDGPYSRVWILDISGEIFKIIVDDPYGSSMVAQTAHTIKKLKELIPSIEKFMK